MDILFKFNNKFNNSVDVIFRRIYIRRIININLIPLKMNKHVSWNNSIYYSK